MNRGIHAAAAAQRPLGRALSDPLTAALQPPANETQLERENRVRRELEAKKRSDSIDRALRDDDRRSRRRKVVKVLLLGQSESGKSTTLKRECRQPFLFFLSVFPSFSCVFLVPRGLGNSGHAMSACTQRMLHRHRALQDRGCIGAVVPEARSLPFQLGSPCLAARFFLP